MPDNELEEKRDKKAERPKVWGHRGAMDEAPQNTLPSFQLAETQGADGIELDVQLTKDGTLAVFHDAILDHLTDGRGPVGGATWKEIRLLDAGRHFGRAWAGTRIPSLDEVLESLSGSMTVNIELKTSLSESPWWRRWARLVAGPREVPTALQNRAQDEGRSLAEAVARKLGSSVSDRFWISSFDPWALRATSEIQPALRLGFLHSPTIPWNTPECVRDVPLNAWHPHHTQVNPGMISDHQAAGHAVHVWTVNDPAHALSLAQIGVDAILTNRPGEVLRSLSQR